MQWILGCYNIDYDLGPIMQGISSLVVATLSLVTTGKHERHDLRPIFQLAPFHTYTSKNMSFCKHSYNMPCVQIPSPCSLESFLWIMGTM